MWSNSNQGPLLLDGVNIHNVEVADSSIDPSKEIHENPYEWNMVPPCQRDGDEYNSITKGPTVLASRDGSICTCLSALQAHIHPRRTTELLTLQHCKELEIVTYNDNEEISPCTWHALATGLHNNKMLQRLNFVEFSISAQDLQLLQEGFRQPNTTLRTLEFSNCSFSFENMAVLGEIIRQCPGIYSISMESCCLGDEQLYDVLKGLVQDGICSTLAHLILSGNYCRSTSLAFLKCLLESESCRLKTLLLGKASQDSFDGGPPQLFDVSLIASGLLVNKSLEVLDLSQQELTDESLQYLLPVLLCHEKLRRLDLSQNDVTNVGIVKLAQCLKQVATTNMKSCLQSVFVDFNLFGSVGWSALTNAAQCNCKLLYFVKFQILPDNMSKDQVLMQHYLDLNYAHMKLVMGRLGSFTPALWPLILNRITKADKFRHYSQQVLLGGRIKHSLECLDIRRRVVNVVYHLLREGQILIQTDCRKRKRGLTS